MKKLVLLGLVLTSAYAYAIDTIVLGDSHMCSNFGVELNHHLATHKNSRTVRTFCAVSTRPLHWIQGKTPWGHKCQTLTNKDNSFKDCGGGNKPMATWDQLMAQHRPHTVVIVMGTNSLEGGTISPDYQKIVDLSAGAKVIWVGPPMLRPDQSKGWAPGRIQKLSNNMTNVYAQLKAKIRGTTLIDIRAMTRKGLPAGETHDGVHRGPKAASAWAKSLADEVKKHF